MEFDKIIGLLFIIIGIVVPLFKVYNFISGYNTLSSEKKKSLNIKGFSRFYGICFAVTGILIFFSSNLTLFMNVPNMRNVLSPFFIIIMVITILIGRNKFIISSK